MMGAPIFILSNPRAGSTLLRYILDTHPDICSPPELRLGMLSRLLLDLLESMPAALDADGRARRFTRVADILNGIMDEYCRTTNKTRWCEKSPHNIDHLDVLNCVFPDAQYICLHRHCRDAVKSLLESGMGGAPVPPGSGDQVNGAIVAAVERWCRRTERLIAFETA